MKLRLIFRKDYYDPDAHNSPEFRTYIVEIPNDTPVLTLPKWCDTDDGLPALIGGEWITEETK